MNLHYSNGTIVETLENGLTTDIAWIISHGPEEGVLTPRDHRTGTLLAAAPEAIALCQAMVDWFDDLQSRTDPSDPIHEAREFCHGKRIARARAAIAKATPKVTP